MKKKRAVPGKTAAKFTEEEMRQAVLKVVEDRISLNRVSKDLNLCKKTLRRYVDIYRSTSADQKNHIRFKPNYEINQVFTHNLENMFESYLVNVHNNERRLTRDYVRCAAYQFAIQCKVHVPQSWNRNKFAGLDWLYGFWSRHPRIKEAIIRGAKIPTLTDDTTEKTSAIDITEYEKYIEEIELEELDSQSSNDVEMLNDMEDSNHSSEDENEEVHVEEIEIDTSLASSSDDETMKSICSENKQGIESRQQFFQKYLKICPETPEKPLDCFDIDVMNVKTPIDEFEDNITEAYQEIVRKNRVPADRVYCLEEIVLVVDNPCKECSKVEVTVCCCVNASGTSLSPFMIFPYPKFTAGMLRGSPKYTSGTVTPNGHINEKIFLDVLRHFSDLAQTSITKKAVFIMDDASHHVTIDSIDFCKKHGITLVTIPPYYSIKLHPIERYVFKTLKSYFNRAYKNFRAENEEAIITVYDVATLFFTIYPYAFVREKIIFGFRDTAIYPLDEELLKEVNFLETNAEKDSEEILPDEIQLVQTNFDESEDLQSELCMMDELLSDEQEDDSECIKNEPSKSLKEEFLENLVAAYDELNANGGIVPENVYNMDEIVLRIYNPFKNKATDNVIKVTVCCYVNAAGFMVPPFIVYPGTDFDESMLTGGIDGINGIAAGSYTVGELSMLMLKHFQQYVCATPENRVLLIMDADRDHVTISWLDFCKEHGIILVAVPSHVSLSLQPLEKTIFKKFPFNFKKGCLHFLKEQQKQRISKNDIAAILKIVFDDVFSSSNIIHSFLSTGLWPLNDNLLPDVEVGLDSVAASPQAAVYLTYNGCEDWESNLPKNEIDNWFSNLNAAFEQFDEAKHLFPDRIYVLGALSLSIPQIEKIYEKNILKSIYCCVNAAGHTLPPFMVFTVPFEELLKTESGNLTGIGIGTDDDAFLKVLLYFRNQVGCKPGNEVLLLTDGIETHENDSRVQFCDNNGIIWHMFPNRCAEDVHPLKSYIFNSLQMKFYEKWEQTLAKEDGLISIGNLIRVFRDVYNKECSPSRILDAFKRSRIWPRQLINTGSDSDLERYFDSQPSTSKRRTPSFTSKDGKNIGEFVVQVMSRTEFFNDTQKKTKYNSHRCRYCDVILENRNARDEHEKTHMNGTMHCCPVCSRECGSKAALVQHRRKHILRNGIMSGEDADDFPT